MQSHKTTQNKHSLSHRERVRVRVVVRKRYRVRVRVVVRKRYRVRVRVVVRKREKG